MDSCVLKIDAAEQRHWYFFPMALFLSQKNLFLASMIRWWYFDDLEMNDKIFNEGLILQCMPGCKYVSIGGMIANNISGKLLINNKIENFIQSFKLINNKKQVIECSRKKNKKLQDVSIRNGKRLYPEKQLSPFYKPIANEKRVITLLSRVFVRFRLLELEFLAT